MASFFSSKHSTSTQQLADSGQTNSAAITLAYSPFRLIECPVIHAGINQGFPKVQLFHTAGFGADGSLGFGSTSFGAGYFIELTDFAVEYENETTLRIAVESSFFDEYSAEKISANKYILKAKNTGLELTLVLS